MAKHDESLPIKPQRAKCKGRHSTVQTIFMNSLYPGYLQKCKNIWSVYYNVCCVTAFIVCIHVFYKTFRVLHKRQEKGQIIFR